MLHLDFNAVNFAIALGISHFVTIFAAWSIHWVLHREIFGISFYKVHLSAHHSPEVLPPAVLYRAATIEHSVWIIGMGVFIVAYFWLLGGWLLPTFLIEFIISAVITYYLHLEYANSRSWLNRYAWFRRDRQLHGIHHRYGSDRFTQSRNYLFGGVMGYLFDRLFGTFEPLSVATSSQVSAEESQ